MTTTQMRSRMLDRINANVTLVVVSMLIVSAALIGGGCDRSEVDDTQRSWLSEQHALEKRLVATWHTHDSLRRSAPADHSLETVDAESNVRFLALDSGLTARRRTLEAIDALIDRHSLVRDNAIRADDAEAIARGLADARKDYVRVAQSLDSVHSEFVEFARMVKRIAYKREPGDTTQLPAIDSVQPVTDSGAQATPQRPPVVQPP
ncbi:MAG: hypothetical protein H7X80_12195 [bacterium]|nr:hypothetical protein [Candidatus Kapabacteria bacterium]